MGMYLPQLRSDKDPDAPDFAEYHYNDQSDYEALKSGLAAIVGCNHEQGTATLWGTGVLLGSAAEMHIATATHVLTGIANSLYGPIPTNPIFGDNDRIRQEMGRLTKLIKQRNIKAVVQPFEYGPTYTFDVVGFAGGEEMGTDCTLLQCAIPKDVLSKINFNTLMMDDDPVAVGEPVLMAGFIKPMEFSDEQDATIAINNLANAAIFRKNLVVRASRIVEITDNPGWVKPGALHMRLSMPSIHGMSGGAVIRLRTLDGRPIRNGDNVMSTTVGIISRKGNGTDREGNSVEHTWATPMNVLTSVIGFIKYIIITYQDIRLFRAQHPRSFRSSDSRMGVDFVKVLTHKRDRLKREEKRNAKLKVEEGPQLGELQ